jgi:hypothetical protein
MSSVRGINVSSVQASPSPFPSPSPSSHFLNMTNNALTVYLRNSGLHHNMTTEEITIALGDPSPPAFNNVTSDQIILICALIVCCSLGVLIAHILEKKGIIHNIKLKLLTLKPIIWLKSKYVEINKNEVLPMYRPKKAKESPFVTSMPMPQLLPQCPRLEGAEKGENLMFKLSVPYRRFHSSENLPEESEHRITITTTVEQTPKQPSKV